MHLATYVAQDTYFVHSNWLGTVQARTNSQGAIAQGYTSLPFGDSLSQVGMSPTHFTDQDRDSETGLDHFLYRQYSSTQGRWMTPDPGGLGVVDPTNPQSWNRYAYVMNNPINFIDFVGLECYASDQFGNCTNWGTGGNLALLGGFADVFQLTGIPVYNWIYGFHPMGPQGVELGQYTPVPGLDNAEYSFTIGETGWYWGQVGTAIGIDIGSPNCQLFCGPDGNQVFNRVYPSDQTPPHIISAVPPMDLREREMAIHDECVIEALNANNDLGLPTPAINAQIPDSSGVNAMLLQRMQGKNIVMNPEGVKDAEEMNNFVPPAFFVQAADMNCESNLGN